eukprot:1802321-Pleurochrysis_carterae.AAC.2
MKGSSTVRVLRAPPFLVRLAWQHRLRRRSEQQRHLLIVAGREDGERARAHSVVAHEGDLLEAPRCARRVRLGALALDLAHLCQKLIFREVAMRSLHVHDRVEPPRA